MKIIILAGGYGTRLFPLSRKKLPKQFLKINGKKSLFQETIERILFFANISDLIIVSNIDFQFYIENQLSELFANLGIKQSSGLFNSSVNLLFEPVGRNTASSIALAVKFALEKLNVSKNEVLVVVPSDHVISPIGKFIEYIKVAQDMAKKDYIVTFGIKPIRLETGYGYIEADSKPIPISISYNQFSIKPIVYKVKHFYEKPNLETVKKFLISGNYYWNSGIFVFKIETILQEMKKYAPEIYKKLINFTFDEFLKNFETMPDISIDYAVMEKTKKAIVLPVDINWCDMGSWDTFYETMEKDENGNVKIGNIIAINTKNSLIFSEKKFISTIGVEDLIIIDTNDVLLIMKRGESQKVKEVVKKLEKDENLKHLIEFPTTVYRPWGSYKELEKGNKYKIKKIIVNPGEALSLQLHHHRSEHWIVVKGIAKVVLEDENGNLNEFLINENESIFVPQNRKHRIINPGKIPLEIIEVQVGDYIGEDDIVRFEDKYNRI